MPLHNLIYLAILTLLPVFELRLSIPIGIAMGENPAVVFAVCVAANAALGPLVYFALDRFVHLFLRFSAVASFYDRMVLRARKKSQHLVERYGIFGLAIFIGIPLPGTGAWTGALVAYILGFGYRRTAVATLLGVVMAGVIVTALSLGVVALA